MSPVRNDKGDKADKSVKPDKFNIPREPSS